MRRFQNQTFLLPLFTLGLVVPTHAQSGDSVPAANGTSARSMGAEGTGVGFAQLSSGKIAAPVLQLKNLNKTWRRVMVGAGGQTPSPFYGGMQGPMFQEILSDLGVGVYYTQWQSITLGNETYLIAYRLDSQVTQQEIQQAFQQMYGGHGHGQDDAPLDGPRRFGPNTRLKLSLLNLRASGSLTDIRAFDASRELLRPVDIIEASNDNLRRLGRYFPQMARFERQGMRGLPMQNVTAARNAFRNFFHAPERIFLHPETRDPYRPNTALAGKRWALISNRAKVVGFYEAQPGSDKKRGVVFLDGRVERVPEWQWKTVKAALPKGLEPREIDRLSLKSLQQLARQVRRYSQYRGVLPPMKDAATVRRALAPYGGYNNSDYAHPVSKAAYRPNPALGGKRLNDIANAAQLVAFYEAAPGADGKRGAVFLDGHAERIEAARWNRVRNIAVQMKRTASSKKPNARRVVGTY